jgi:hypothetical protein
MHNEYGFVSFSGFRNNWKVAIGWMADKELKGI